MTSGTRASQSISWNIANTRPRQRRSSTNEEHEAYLARRRARYQRRRMELVSTTNEIMTNNTSTNPVERADGGGDDALYSVRHTSSLRPITYNTCYSTFESGGASAVHVPSAQTDAGIYVTGSRTNNSSLLRTRLRRFHNLARNFIGFQTHDQPILPNPTTCPHCQALLFHGETSQLCCRNGRTKLDPILSPVELLELFAMENEEGKHFRQYIRAYNHVFSFTSIGVNIDQALAAGSNGIYAFRAQGNIYHSIGSILPHENGRPRYMLMYIVDTDHEVDNRLLENQELRRELLVKIQRILDRCNPFVQVFRQIGQRQDIPSCKLIIKQQKSNERQYCLPTVSQVAAVIVDNEFSENMNGRDIIVEGVNGRLLNIQDVVGYYDPLQYPLLLPYGTYGWNMNSRNIDGSRLTCLEYYSYILQIRANDSSLFLRGGRLLQQYVVDNYVKIEAQSLRWIRTNQQNIRSELYQGLQDCLDGGENIAGNVGRRIVLPSSFTGSPRDMYQRYQDAMTLLHNPDDFDSVVRAEIPSQIDEPRLYEAVVRHMIHGPCGLLNPWSPCMRDGICKNKFPKPFTSYTTRGNDSYPIYRRREAASVPVSENGQVMVDNGWVVPYNPWLLLNFDCHINVEVCGGIKCVKYIYKYIHKGPDRVALELRNGHNYDEIQQFVDGRWICAPEALWRIFCFEFSRMYPSVFRLQIHLPNQQSIRFSADEHVSDIIGDDDNSKTMLTEFFTANHDTSLTERYLYREFPQHYRWVQSKKKMGSTEGLQQSCWEDICCVPI
ncbi:uncharacterized protein [Henckelia pumila]|uniref:uncharacterized protein n=1 Tax=Henckelia pumila TaxID=405737 RepID=UPI003C6E79DC